MKSLEDDWSTTNPNFEATITLAELSVLAYNDEHSRQLTLRLMGFDEVVALDDGPMSGVMARKGDVVVIAFRGTNMYSPADWMTNITFRNPMPMHGSCTLHRGFQEAYARFANEVRLSLQKWDAKHVWITGHSLGGAMAVCCAYDCVIHNLNVTGLVTFGQPRVANPSMAEFLGSRLNDKYLRFINGQDIVPSVPPADWWLVPDYQHAGHSAWFTNGSVEHDVRLLNAAPDDLFASPISPFQTDDPENAISGEDFTELQAALQFNAQQPVMLTQGSTNDYEQQLFGSPTRMQAIPLHATSPEKAVKVQGFMNRFSDHSMLEYVRQLNELHNQF